MLDCPVKPRNGLNSIGKLGKWLDGGAFMHAGDPNAPPP
jgi:hypothetical protein